MCTQFNYSSLKIFHTYVYYSYSWFNLIVAVAFQVTFFCAVFFENGLMSTVVSNANGIKHMRASAHDTRRTQWNYDRLIILLKWWRKNHQSQKQTFACWQHDRLSFLFFFVGVVVVKCSSEIVHGKQKPK